MTYIKLVCLLKYVYLCLTIEKSLAYFEICQCPVDYGSVMFNCKASQERIHAYRQDLQQILDYGGTE